MRGKEETAFVILETASSVQRALTASTREP